MHKFKRYTDNDMLVNNVDPNRLSSCHTTMYDPDYSSTNIIVNSLKINKLNTYVRKITFSLSGCKLQCLFLLNIITYWRYLLEKELTEQTKLQYFFHTMETVQKWSHQVVFLKTKLLFSDWGFSMWLTLPINDNIKRFYINFNLRSIINYQ